MDIDDTEPQSSKQKAEALHSLSTGSLSSSVSKLSHSSRAIPSEKDFHFFYNFDEFKSPVKEIAENSQLMLERVGTSTHVWGKGLVFPDDLDDAYDWLVNVNDELFERFDVLADEFYGVRKKEEESARVAVVLDDGFQLVYGKKKKGMMDREITADVDRSTSASANVTGVKVASRDKKVSGAKARVPFHIPSIPRPQDAFNILANNSNQPFQHVWLQRSEDGTRFVHPLEEHSVLDFVNKDTENIKLVNPPPIEHTPFKLVEEVKDLKELAAKLRAVDEFAVDLEHNQYRSFQGMTCLMQISTRREDFVLDTLKLRIHVGPYLREVFKDPSKKKVMHGADKDILWLQRDFGIYVCNLFDTGQASRVLNLERNSLEYLLYHFCGVTADKEYQNADWRLRPLPYEMLKYGREDTHYLLHIYDLMRIRLLSPITESGNSDNLLVEVYKRSYDVCMQLYEKELLTESSYLYIYGLQNADFNSQQLAVVAGLCEWRDAVARAEDESTGYILPNKTLLEIAKQMPVTTSKLRRSLKTRHPYVERNLGSIISIIRLSIQNASAFEVAAEHLKGEQMEKALEPMLPETSTSLENAFDGTGDISGAETINGLMSTFASVQPKEGFKEFVGIAAEIGGDGQGGSCSEPPGENEKVKTKLDCYAAEQPRGCLTISGKTRDLSTGTSVSPFAKVTGATVQLLKKPTRAFGALLGSSVPKRKLDLDSKYKEQLKLEQIKSSVNLPFFSFSGSNDLSKPVAEVSSKVSDSPPEDLHSISVVSNSTEVLETSPPEDLHSMPTAGTGGLEDVILLDGSTEVENSRNGDSDAMDEGSEHNEIKTQDSALEMDQDGEPMSLSDLSSSFQKCFQSNIKTKTGKMTAQAEESHCLLQLKPFDYEAAWKQFRFGEDFKEEPGVHGNEDKRGQPKLGKGQVQRVEGSGDLPQGKRRQAFPTSGNRSVTFL